MSDEELEVYSKMRSEYDAKKAEGMSDEELCALMKTMVVEAQAQSAAADEDELQRLEVAKKRVRAKGVSAESSDATLGSYEKKSYPKTDEARAHIRAAVSDNFLFSNLDSKNMEEVIDAMFEKTVEAGETVITQGEDGDFFYVIESGEFDAFTQKAGDTPVFHYGNKGSFGELALMYNCPRAATVKSTTAGTLWVMDRATFRAIILTANRNKSERNESFIRKVPLFEGISDGEKSAVADTLMSIEYKDGDTIFSQGDSDRNDMKFYMVESGQAVAVYQMDESSPPVMLKEVGEAGFFGEKALIEGKPRFATMKAKGDLVAAAMDCATFERLMGPCVNSLKESIAAYPTPEEVIAQQT